MRYGLPMTTTQTPPTRVPSRLKLALAPPILVLGGFGLFGVAWDGELLAVLFVSFLAIACGIVGVIPGLVIAIHAALRWQTSEPRVHALVIGLALLSNTVLIAIAVAITVLASTDLERRSEVRDVPVVFRSSVANALTTASSVRRHIDPSTP